MSAQRDAAWDVRESVVATVYTDWDIRELVTATRSTDWAIEAPPLVGQVTVTGRLGGSRWSGGLDTARPSGRLGEPRWAAVMEET